PPRPLLIVRFVSVWKVTGPVRFTRLLAVCAVVVLFQVALPTLTVPPPSPLFARVSTTPALIDEGLLAEVNELLLLKISRPAPFFTSPPVPAIAPPVNVSVALLVIVVLLGVTPAAWIVTTLPDAGLLNVTLSPLPPACAKALATLDPFSHGLFDP